MRRNLFGGDDYFAAFLLSAERRNRLDLAAETLLDARPETVPDRVWEHAVRDALLVAWVAIVKSDIEPSIGELVEGAERVLGMERPEADALARGAMNARDEEREALIAADAERSSYGPGMAARRLPSPGDLARRELIFRHGAETLHAVRWPDGRMSLLHAVGEHAVASLVLTADEAATLAAHLLRTCSTRPRD